MADSTLASLTAASALAGTELIYGTQSGGDVKITANQIKTFTGSGTPGGANTNVQFNNSSAFGGDSGFTYAGTGQVAIVNSTANTAALAISGGSLTGSSAQSFLSLTGTWNTTGVVDAAIFANITNTASGAAAKLMDLQVGGATKFNVDKAGAINITGGLNINSTGLTPGAGQLAAGGSAFFQVGGVTSIYLNTAGGNTAGNGITVVSGHGIGWSSSSTNALVAPDTILCRGLAAATLNLGLQDAAAPVAQTLQVQSVVAGTSNTAGTDWTIIGSRGTGTGAGGKIIFQTASAGTTGTTQNAATNALVLKVGTVVLTSYTVANLPAAATAGAGATAFVTDASTTLVLGLGGAVTGGGTNKVPVYSDGTNWNYG